jgi:hypothetical protein
MISPLQGIPEDGKVSNIYTAIILGPKCEWTSTIICGIVIPANKQNQVDMLHSEYYHDG